MATGFAWRAYAIEMLALGCFMVSALTVTVILEHPASPVRHALPDAVVRRGLTGIAMGLTAAAIVYSRWGRRSGAHINPAVTFTFWRLGKIAPRDAVLYVVAQFAGGLGGVLLVAAAVRPIVADPAVNYVGTMPGPAGVAAALAGEAVISFGLMLTILTVSNSRRLAGYTGVAAACLVALYITIEAPLSGMSMNPARSLGPALVAGSMSSIWIYFVAPLAGMLLAAELFVRRRGVQAVLCAKLHHPASGPCHFNCAWHAEPAPQDVKAVSASSAAA
jgi:aquaporin Z